MFPYPILTLLKTYKYRIYPNNQQKELIEKSFGVCRFIYNLALETKIEAYKRCGKILSAFDLCYELPGLKEDYPWIAEVNAQSLQVAINQMDISFKNFYRGYGFPNFKKKLSRQSFRCPGGVRKIDFNAQTITIPKIKDIPAVVGRTFEGEIKTVTISRTPTGKYYAAFLVDNKKELPGKPEIDPNNTIGIDLGIKSIAVTSDGRFFEPNRRLKNSLKRLQCLSSRASRKKKGSKNRKKANKRVALLHEKIVNQRTDYIHKVTTGLIRDNQAETFVMEDLNVAGMLKNRGLSQAISDVCFGEFKRQMQYKCDWYGKNLLFIGRFEPSSKTCYCCGAKNETLTLKDREWVCPNCGTLHDRDLNAAKNIRQMGLNNILGAGSSGEPVEKRRLRRSKKQEKVMVKTKT